MRHEIDLKKYDIRTDLVDYYIKDNDVYEENYIEKGIKIKRFYINEDNSKIINKKKGNYITLTYDDITDSNNFDTLANVTEKEINLLMKKNNISKNKSCLVIGLGNIKSTPDALGPLTIEKILVTNPIYELSGLDKGFRRTYALSPNVYANTGIETSDYIKNIVKTIKVDFVIVIDSLASESIDRVNKTIQITDTGIHPGSGIGNNRKEICYENLNIPVIAIGIPTVVDAITIVADTIDYLYKNYAYNQKNMNNPKNKLILYKDIAYNDVEDMKKEEKEKIFGVIGSLETAEIKQLIFEVLSPVGLNMMVTPKEVDYLIKRESELIGQVINKALHKKYK